ncbi:SH3 domain-binding glutamic acid-rich-like protein 3 isoform X2 [Ambystoma mexicanum]|uniref:SH3 domain-binding glutamic acid-rich-like protein 3 n=1 Tax=Ailuropoda melanoleuca TaxID=9646 RepID=A0A7N5P1I1_AILME|nr:SH3 domain-binding glutamic acid-rich-like protein 3 [Ailuropoda melanoleuca]
MSLKVYTTSVTASREIKSLQAEVTRVLESKCKEFENVDISQDNCLREEMRTKAGNPTAMPPQIFNGDMYCGDGPTFMNAVEEDNLDEFLKLK